MMDMKVLVVGISGIYGGVEKIVMGIVSRCVNVEFDFLCYGNETENRKKIENEQQKTEQSTATGKQAQEDYYTVQRGDTLDKISLKLYGTANHVEAICKMNGLTDGNLIYIGQKLLLP